MTPCIVKQVLAPRSSLRINTSVCSHLIYFQLIVSSLYDETLHNDFWQTSKHTEEGSVQPVQHDRQRRQRRSCCEASFTGAAARLCEQPNYWIDRCEHSYRQNDADWLWSKAAGQSCNLSRETAQHLDGHKIFYRPSWFPEDESQWLLGLWASVRFTGWWFWVKCLNNYQTDCHEMWFGHFWSA